MLRKMTDEENKKNITKALYSNITYDKVVFNEKDFTPTNRGHGLFVQTLGSDVLIDLRLADKKPFWGHTHPIQIQHNLGNLSKELKLNHYSVPKTEFHRMIETFQKVHFTEFLSEDFEITYYNIVIFFDEEILNYNIKDIQNKVKNFIQKKPETLFWIVESDILLLNENFLHLIEWGEDTKTPSNVHQCIQFHFISSVYIKSNHLFSEDENIQIFLAISEYFNTVLTLRKNGKNSIDFEIIDSFLSREGLNSSIKRIGRYLSIDKKYPQTDWLEQGILIEDNPKIKTTFIAIPYSCTNSELLDTLTRIKAVLK